jgi:hypothetical protein
MQTTFFKMMTVVGILFLSVASCTNKTKNMGTTESAPSQQQQPPPQNGGNGQRRQPPAFTDVLAKLDADKDGKISKTEAQGPLKNHFSRIDTDGDGFITAEEFKKIPPPPRN